jgi:hypothetical protein
MAGRSLATARLLNRAAMIAAVVYSDRRPQGKAVMMFPQGGRGIAHIKKIHEIKDG